MTSDSIPPLPSQRKARSGCLVALYVMLGVGALLLLATGIGAWLFVRSEQGQKVIGVVQEGITLVKDAATAPGTVALREAGCSQAMVMPSARIFDLVDEVSSRPARPAETATRRDQTYILCRVTREDDEAPGCADTARVYGGAVSNPPARLAVVVQHQRRGGTQCQGVYAPDGSFIEPLDRSEQPDATPGARPTPPAATEPEPEPLERP